MTEHERLLEEFEDARFALLMEGVARKEGERLEALNEMLQENPEAAVPESVNRRCLETIDRHFARERRRAVLGQTGRALRLAGVVMAISALLFTSALALSEDFREAAMELVRTVTGAYTQLDMRRTEDDGLKAEKAEGHFKWLEVGWVPEGFGGIGGGVGNSFINH